jgi:hypothetical protein
MDFYETPIVWVTYPHPFQEKYKPSQAQLEMMARTVCRPCNGSKTLEFRTNTETALSKGTKRESQPRPLCCY